MPDTEIVIRDGDHQCSAVVDLETLIKRLQAELAMVTAFGPEASLQSSDVYLQGTEIKSSGILSRRTGCT